jgi:hypothetical protein
VDVRSRGRWSEDLRTTQCRKARRGERRRRWPSAPFIVARREKCEGAWWWPRGGEAMGGTGGVRRGGVVAAQNKGVGSSTGGASAIVPGSGV